MPISIAVDWSLFALIWVVQLFIYPNFQQILANRFVAWHTRYTKLMGFVAGPIMVAQLLFTLGKFFLGASPLFFRGVHLFLVVSTWLVTFFVMVPMHNRLQERGQDMRLIRQLIKANWLRTILWSVIPFLSFGSF